MYNFFFIYASARAFYLEKCAFCAQKSKFFPVKFQMSNKNTTFAP